MCLAPFVPKSFRPVPGVPQSVAWWLLLVCTLAGASSAHAQPYPTKPIRIVAPFAAGGGGDIMARLIGQKLVEILGRQIVVDARPGAGAVIGTDIVAKAAPDGYTILLVNNTHAINASLRRNLPYDSLKDFAPITLLASTPFLMVVNPALPAKSIPDLIRLAKEKPDLINYGSGGNGTSGHLTAELFKIKAGVRMTHIPFKGISGAIIDTIAGNVQLTILSPLSLMPDVKSGRLRAIAVTSAVRSPMLPDIPTIQEGGVRDYDYISWYGLLAPGATPAPLVERLNKAVVQALAFADLRARLITEGNDIIGGSPADFRKFLEQETAKYAKLVREINLQPD